MQLLNEILRELGELVLDLKLDASGQESGALQQTSNHRVALPFQQAAKALRDTRVLLGELAGVVTKKAEFSIIKIEEFAVHELSLK
jgi:hypothetical protein